jgi:hypothetical protein
LATRLTKGIVEKEGFGLPFRSETLDAIADPYHRDAAEWFDDYRSAQPVWSAAYLTD